MFLDLALQTCKTSTGPQLNWSSVPTLLSEDKRKKLRRILSSYFVLVFFNLRAVWRVREKQMSQTSYFSTVTVSETGFYGNRRQFEWSNHPELSHISIRTCSP